MLLRGNPACHRRRDDFVLQDAPVPKRNGCNAPYGQDRVVNLVGQFVPTREPSFLDSSGKDNPPPRNPRTENSLSVSPHLPPILHLFRRAGIHAPPASRSYFSSLLSGQRAPVHCSRNCCPSPLRGSSRC